MMVLILSLILLIYQINSEQVFDVSGIHPTKLGLKLPAESTELRGKQFAANAIDQQLTRNESQLSSFFSETSFLDFEPKILDFGTSELYVVKTLPIRVINRSMSERVEFLHQFIMESVHFKIHFFPKRSLEPSSSYTIQVSYIPTSLGSHNTLMIFNTNFRPVVYPVQGYANKNIYGAKEVNVMSIGKNQKENFNIYNPHPFPILLESLYCEDPYVGFELNLEVVGGKRPILPKEKVLATKIFGYSKNEGVTTTKFKVSLNTTTLMVPVTIHTYKAGLNFPFRILSFGVLTEKDLLYRLPLIVSNTGNDTILIENLLEPANSDHLDGLIVQDIIPFDSNDITFGYLSFNPKEEGQYYGKIKVQTNKTEYTLEYTAIVHYDVFSYNTMDTIFQVGINTERVISLENNLSRSIYIYDIIPPEDSKIIDFHEM